MDVTSLSHILYLYFIRAVVCLPEKLFDNHKIEEILTKKNPYHNDDRSLIWAFLFFCFIKISVSFYVKITFFPDFFDDLTPVAHS